MLCDPEAWFLGHLYVLRQIDRASLLTQQSRIHLLMQETQVRSLGWEDPLEKRMATHCSILAWRFPCTEELGGLRPMGSQRVTHD